jgi:glycosyltransferase 2 family protein
VPDLDTAPARTERKDAPPTLARRALRHASQVLPALLAIGLTGWVLRTADLSRSLELVRSLGWRLPLLLIPNFVVAVLEATGWRRSLARLGPVPRFLPILRVRLITEATMMGLPSGAVISESLQPYLLKRGCGMPFESAVVAGVGRKSFVVVSHGFVMAVSTLLAWPLLNRISHATIRRGGLPWVLMAAALFMIGAFGFGIFASANGRLVERFRLALDRVFGRWMGDWLKRHAGRFQRADEQMIRFYRNDPRGLVAPMLLYCAGWLVRGLESLAFLSLLDVTIPFNVAVLLESTLVLVRSVAVPVPAGLGIQDVGYVLSLRAIGVPDATTVSAAFVLMKRGRDIFWIVVGFLLLGGERRKARG